jgi:hypothetical protein
MQILVSCNSFGVHLWHRNVAECWWWRNKNFCVKHYQTVFSLDMSGCVCMSFAISMETYLLRLIDVFTPCFVLIKM